VGLDSGFQLDQIGEKSQLWTYLNTNILAKEIIFISEGMFMIFEYDWICWIDES